MPLAKPAIGVVGPGLLGAPVAEQIRRDDRVVLGQLLDDRAARCRSCHRCRGSGGGPGPTRP